MSEGDPGSELGDVPRPVGALPSRGVYALVINVSQDLRVRPGGLGEYLVGSGVYVYVGSALKPGLLRLRVARHLAKEKPLRWHIDYLTSRAEVAVEAVVAAEAECKKAECLLVRHLINENFTIVIPRFGSSDCDCPSHLLRSPLSPRMEETCRVVADVLSGLSLKPMEAWLR